MIGFGSLRKSRRESQYLPQKGDAGTESAAIEQKEGERPLVDGGRKRERETTERGR